MKYKQLTMKIDIFDTNKKYDIIYTDPPWKQRRGGAKSARPNSSGKELDYPTMELSEIKELHKTVLKNNTEDRHNVFMWTIDKYLHETEQMMKELGYELHARMIWDKVTGIPSAFTVRYSHEYLLWFYRKGYILKPCDEMRGKYSTVFRERVIKHSKKPICAYEMIENMFPNAKKLEMFARSERNGWDCWGNEV